MPKPNSPFCLSSPTRRRRSSAFTLIELLVVISVIAILAAMVFPITKAVNRNKIRAKARAELAMVEAAIGSYKEKLGHYPPDNPDNPWVNQLYFELLGCKATTSAGGVLYETLDGSARITSAQLATALGNKVAGIVNCSRGGGGDEGKAARPFLNGLRNGQYAEIAPGIRILTCSVLWPGPNQWITGMSGVNPFRYSSSNPTNNPGSFDLWVDVIVDGKTNRISNWSKEPLIVSNPF